jgi:ABC-type dipeptide/oligopeptide/nickel transport system permease component
MEELLKVDWDEKKRRLVDLLEPLFIAYLYILAVLSPVLGLILGIVALKKCQLEKNKRVGKICVIISIVGLGLWTLCIVAYVIIIVAVTATGGMGGF